MPLNDFGRVLVRFYVEKKPTCGAFQHTSEAQQPPISHARRQRFSGDASHQGSVVAKPAGDQPSSSDLGRAEPSVPRETIDERGPHEVDEVIRELGGDDLAAQAMAFEALLTRRRQYSGRKVIPQVVLGRRIVRKVTPQQATHQVELGVGQEHAEFRA